MGFHELSTELLEKMQRKKVIFSVVEFPMGFLSNLDKEVKENFAKPAIKTLVQIAVKFKVDFDVFFRFVEEGYDGEMALQGYASPQPAVILDPVSQLPVVFCNLHSHSKFLRDDMFTDEELLEVDRATMKVLKMIDMKKGDVVLLDNYRTMHGRGTFEGSRHNAVAWFSKIKNWSPVQ